MIAPHQSVPPSAEIEAIRAWSSGDSIHISRASSRAPNSAARSDLGERSPRLDAVGVSVIPAPPAPFVANGEPLERSQAWWIGAKSIRMRHQGKALTGRPDTRLWPGTSAMSQIGTLG